jgi:hypothetical protein
MIYNTRNLKNLIKKCIYEENTNKKTKLFFKINSLLPEESKIHIPSFITNDYINKMLYKLEEINTKKQLSEQMVNQ